MRKRSKRKARRTKTPPRQQVVDVVCRRAAHDKMTPVWDEKSLLEALQTVKQYTPAVREEGN